ncbi:ABC transporter permease [Enterococcus sp. BWB1-3]|uniref:ABC transporter permease n=1 Tax=unclassified Enterococcus TaxID=2608891 RepID=UPI0019233FD3|nr:MULTISPECIES: ABC transporter permease [unclassified Enterococcus]MBL1229283.1 ABC transporter permease [Enterococcus sp. BWB1-3]MCB5951773.1 ABC transporter permease [Enterococcus sp. BWT-B8]
MTHLLKIELKKINLKKQVFSLLLMNMIVLLLSIFTSVLLADPANEGAPAAATMLLTTSELSMLIIRAVLIVWQAIFIVQIIIEEYKSKTITVLFTYPFSKRELILAKLGLIFLLTAAFSIFSIMFQSLSLFMLSHNFSLVTFSSESLWSLIIVLISNLFLGFLPLFIGMRNVSIIATIISSLVIVVIGSNSQASPAGLLGVPAVSLFLGTVSVALLSITYRSMLRKEV